MKAATSAWFGPYAAATRAAGGTTRARAGRVIVLIALLTALRTRSAAGTVSTSLSEAHGTTSSSGAHRTVISAELSSPSAPRTRPPCTTVRTADHPSSPVAWLGITASAANATVSSLLTCRFFATAWSSARDTPGSIRQDLARIASCSFVRPGSVAMKRRVLGSSTSEPASGMKPENGA